MTSNAFGTAIAEMAGSSAARLGASVFDASPLWKGIERQTRMLERIGRRSRMLEQVGRHSRILEQVTAQSGPMMALAATGQRLAELVATPAVEQFSSSYRRLGEGLARSALASSKLPEMRLPDLEATFKTHQLIEQSFRSLAAAQGLGFALPMNRAGSWERVLRQLPELDVEFEDDGEPDDPYPAVTGPVDAPLLSLEERVLLVRSFWVLFVAVQLVTPEGRQLLHEYPIIWGLINAIVFSSRPRQ